MTFDLQKQLLSLASSTQKSAALLRSAVCEECRPGVSEISDLNRQTLSDLADAERALLFDLKSPRALAAVRALAACVSHAFCAAMLVPQNLPALPPLREIVSASELLASYPPEILQGAPPAFYHVHLAANKGRGAHAILITHYCLARNDFSLLPLALALEDHRNALENAAGTLIDQFLS